MFVCRSDRNEFHHFVVSKVSICSNRLMCVIFVVGTKDVVKNFIVNLATIAALKVKLLAFPTQLFISTIRAYDFQLPPTTNQFHQRLSRVSPRCFRILVLHFYKIWITIVIW